MSIKKFIVIGEICGENFIIKLDFEIITWSYVGRENGLRQIGRMESFIECFVENRRD